MLSKKLVIYSSIFTLPISISPFVISCSSSSSNSQDKLIVETTNFDKYIKEQNINTLIKPSSSISIKNFVEIKYWKNIDDLIQKLNTYFMVEQKLIDYFKNNKEGQKVYSKIKTIKLQVKEGSKDIQIIWVLNNSSSDKNIVTSNIVNALPSSFQYTNLIVIPSKVNIEVYKDFNEFKNTFEDIYKRNSKANEISWQEKFKNMLKRAFNLDEASQQKLLNAYGNESKNELIGITRSEGNTIYLTINQKGIDEGFMFKKDGANSQATITIQSGSLVK